ncbi:MULTISPECIES: hypothetical protein [Streptomyces]|uniref:hypothetical protein n=1 Tax=Streptomyces TaxID=1883 RepID=UPI00167497CF|nr:MULTISPECIES: hypothetical protein [Streptomyces]MBD3579633.1 hypothetical protein [Streptomyces sp. KD18]GGS89368.1 hypothetical protein GCM10010286_12510 [Streptomyces toxytricini]
MRLRKALALCALLAAVAAPAAAAAAATADVGNGSGARPAPALPSRARASCGDGKSTAFPIGARIRGGPSVYRTGGGSQSWFLDLTNTTASRCTAIHPVVVLADEARALRADHLRMDFDTPEGTLPVSLEESDRDEIIAVFDGGDAFSGYTLDAGGSLTVKVHLAFAPDAPPGEVVADAAVVQRRGDDGDWVGEAGGYRFTVESDEEPVQAGSLAHTGPQDRHGATVAATAVTTGAALLLAAHRLRRRTQPPVPRRTTA